jgi:predicted nucleotidyltransferase
MNKPIFGSGREKILECFYRNRNRELYFSEILKGTGLTPNTTLKHLQVLQHNRFILSEKRASNTFYKLNPKNPGVFSILSYFDYKIFNNLPAERRRAISEFLDKIEPKPLIALIFGSTAKKAYKPESDIDMLLVFSGKASISQRIKGDIEATTGMSVQTFPIDYGYFREQFLKQEDNVIMHAIKTGFVMSGHYYFYREVLR